MARKTEKDRVDMKFTLWTARRRLGTIEMALNNEDNYCSVSNRAWLAPVGMKWQVIKFNKKSRVAVRHDAKSKFKQKCFCSANDFFLTAPERWATERMREHQLFRNVAAHTGIHQNVEKINGEKIAAGTEKKKIDQNVLETLKVHFFLRFSSMEQATLCGRYALFIDCSDKSKSH